MKEATSAAETQVPDKYVPSEQEAAIEALWEENKIGKPVDNGKGRFSMVLPPPNATGELHLGHALMLTVEDTYARYRRLRGEETVWVPGTDHAAIATQAKVEKLLPAGTTRHTLGREEFLKRVNEFVADSQATIRSQVKIMGASLDWDRDRYTLGADESKLVQETFVKMYHDGLIYRGTRVINWDPKAMSAIADDEVEYKDDEATLYFIKYNEDITVATTQPETKLGDPALLVHPEDERYKKYVGTEIEVSLAGHPLKLKIVADESIDPAFGTGVLGCTPAHSMTDAELGRKHGLKEIKLYGGDGVMLAAAGKYAGMALMDARAAFVADLKASGQLAKEEKYLRQIPVSERSGAVVLNVPSEQWFVSVDRKFNSAWGEKTLKEISLDVVRDGSVEIVPERFNKVYFNWMENLHDWCVSRQIWFGHRIPAYYSSKGGTFVGLEKPADTADETWAQDSDTLDTWFSSGMWTFSCFLQPARDGETLDAWLTRSKVDGDLARYHPTSLLETGYDILFFWVARMILLTTYVMGEVPFKKVYLHGLARDEQGRKMSKSLGNGIDPRETAREYGADATRLALLLGSTPGNDTKVGISKIEGYRNYVTKIWNVSRFILARLDDKEKLATVSSPADRWIMGRLQAVIADASRAMEQDRLSDAGTALYDFTWRELADWYLEIIKIPEFYPHPEALEYVLRSLLALQHPFVPFVTEFVWQQKWAAQWGPLAAYNAKAPGKNWPEAKDGLRDAALESDFEKIKEIVERIRFQRAERKVAPAEIVSVALSLSKGTATLSQNVAHWQKLVEKLARVAIVETKEGEADPFVAGVEINYAWPAAAEADPAKREAERAQLAAYVVAQEAKLSNQEFVGKAPAAVIDKERQKLEEAKEKLAKLS